MPQNDSESKLTQLKDLARQFSANIKEYKGSKYNETNTRVDYIDKFFSLLGWDMANDDERIEKKEKRRNLTTENTEYFCDLRSQRTHGGCCIWYYLFK